MDCAHATPLAYHAIYAISVLNNDKTPFDGIISPWGKGSNLINQDSVDARNKEKKKTKTHLCIDQRNHGQRNACKVSHRHKTCVNVGRRRLQYH